MSVRVLWGLGAQSEVAVVVPWVHLRDEQTVNYKKIEYLHSDIIVTREHLNTQISISQRP